ncbi:MAG: N-acetyl-glucosamine transferase, partial [Sciscionella sp.]
LCQPWMQLLGTLIYPVPFLLTLIRTVQDPHAVASWFTGGAWILFAIYSAFGLLPFLIWGPIYRAKCEHKVGILRSIGYGFVYAAYIYTFYITSWRAAIRLIRGRNGWAKTRRNNEILNTGAVALDH